MITIESLKEKLLEHLDSLELSSLSMQDLNTYVFILSTLNSIEKFDYMDTFLKMASSGMAFDKVETKEGE
ncbi:MAG: hypothetical protein IJ302_01660 [Clostridia bacterium]|nr:hypothetical protein [Clostridia bacterium]